MKAMLTAACVLGLLLSAVQNTLAQKGSGVRAASTGTLKAGSQPTVRNHGAQLRAPMGAKAQKDCRRWRDCHIHSH